ncbi:MAG: 4-(cytidine 5'-diphospho)-2-C-methyl-D-erythritol kinase [Ignavibacterium sp.]|jgi:4-diphosphocytidyl-2-C-methyl-D-erythritol kinase|nr:4-(cytidine 5'-diphospho)-2-C-methyl-D-erythritol kinase [Ignavibacterium sp.]
MDNIKIKSPAKINIGLNIINKREDGYHNLETIFYPLDLFDEITITKSNSFSFDSNDKQLNLEKTNLIIKTKEILENFFQTTFNVNIFLKKEIPIGSGLGGGSSNAASTLIGFNKLFDLKISNSDLSRLALSLGSDVPFFLNPVPSFAESRGETLYPLNIITKKFLLIVNPGIHISTKWAFGLIKPSLPKSSLKLFTLKQNISIDEIITSASNDFENIVFTHFPVVSEVKEKMIELGAKQSMMTGTGSTVWGMFDEKEAAFQTELYFKRKNYFVFIQETI